VLAKRIGEQHSKLRIALDNHNIEWVHRLLHVAPMSDGAGNLR
jgi:hypothetical protein